MWCVWPTFQKTAARLASSAAVVFCKTYTVAYLPDIINKNSIKELLLYSYGPLATLGLSASPMIKQVAKTTDITSN